MSENPVLALTERQEWLQPIQERGEAFVKGVFEAAGSSGQSIKNALHGTWLGHPVHSAITDVPVGSWTAAAVLDLLEARGNTQHAPGADVAVAVGLVGAMGAAVTGMTDWSDTHGKPQRIGALHGLLNVAAAALYTTSYVCRRMEKRSLGRSLGFLGYGLVLASAWLGGELAYSQKIGVTHAPDPAKDFPKEFTPVLDEAELLEGKPTKASVNGTDILLLRREGTIYALANTCSHLAGPLSEGKVIDDTIQCPWHGSRFCLKTGSVVDGPAVNPQPRLDVKVENGRIFVKSGEAA